MQSKTDRELLELLQTRPSRREVYEAYQAWLESIEPLRRAQYRIYSRCRQPSYIIKEGELPEAIYNFSPVVQSVLGMLDEARKSAMPPALRAAAAIGEKMGEKG